MQFLTTRQIDDFNNPLAFARSRSATVGSQVPGAPRDTIIRTGNMEESYRLVTGASGRLETLEGNLKTMLQIAKEGERARTDTRKQREAYGKLRSLSAGFDQVVDAIQFKGRPVFTGNNLQLSLGPGGRPLSIDVARLLTYGDKSLNLSQAEPMGDVQIRYGIDDQILNSGYSLVGLDIESASFIRGSNPALELKDGDYKIKVSYLGANSTVEIQSTTGALIERKDNVDLSGSGREWVDFDAGVRLTFAKEQLLANIDKYDFETKGPAYLSATLNYQRIEAHTLRTVETPPAADAASFRMDAALSDGAGWLRASDPRVAPVALGQNPLASGVYNLQVDYWGEFSTVRMTDAIGRIVGFRTGVNLAGNGSERIDLQNGFSFNLAREDFSQMGARLTVGIDYSREAPAIEEFDFKEYAKRIESAIEVVAGQRKVFDKAMADIEENNRLMNLATSSAIPNALALGASGAFNLLTYKVKSPFDPQATRTRLNQMATQLFSTSTALPTQTNFSPDALASIQKASPASWFGLFSS